MTRYLTLTATVFFLVGSVLLGNPLFIIGSSLMFSATAWEAGIPQAAWGLIEYAAKLENERWDPAPRAHDYGQTMRGLAHEDDEVEEEEPDQAIIGTPRDAILATIRELDEIMAREYAAYLEVRYES
jgi:hypothetical protein